MEEAIGISAFLTKTPGIGGKLRKNPEDFVVEEIPAELEHQEDGKYTVARIRSKNWETNRLVRKMAKRLGISRRKIHFAGTKDKRALTTQIFQFEHPPENVAALKLKDVEILDIFTTSKKLKIGDLYGNRFRVVVREMDVCVEEAQEYAFKTACEILQEGGFPNFFGIQRFGAVRPITHTVGRRIIRGDLEGAVMTYLANPIEGEPEDAFLARKAMEENRDIATALKNYPKKLSFEKAVLNHLVKNERDYAGALRQLPKNLLRMFIHAYQSFLFNRVVSIRMKKGIPLSKPILGDYVLPMDSFGIPRPERAILVKERNIEKISKQVEAGKACVSGILFGMQSSFSKGEMGEIERSVVEEEALNKRDFFIRELPELSSKGSRRAILALLNEIEIGASESSLVFTFQLAKGCYATSLLREFMKTDSMSY